MIFHPTNGTISILIFVQQFIIKQQQVQSISMTLEKDGQFSHLVVEVSIIHVPFIDVESNPRDYGFKWFFLLLNAKINRSIFSMKSPNEKKNEKSQSQTPLLNHSNHLNTNTQWIKRFMFRDEKVYRTFSIKLFGLIFFEKWKIPRNLPIICGCHLKCGQI